jgi:ribosome-associated protein
VASSFFSEEQKQLLKEKLSNRINADGFLMVKSQTHRTQLANKQEVVKKMNELVTKALEKKKPRIATKKSKAAKERRLESKKRKAEIKSGRQKLKPGGF